MPTFTATTWNLENLYRAGPGADAADRDRYERKLALLAAVIRRLDPDVIALQEVGGEEPLHDLQQALGGSHAHRAVSAFSDSRGIRCAFLSRLPAQARSDIADFPPGPALDIHGLDGSGCTPPITRMGRGALHIRVTKDALTVDLITAHLKSKLLTFPRSWGSSFSPRDEEERAQIAGIALMRRSAEAVTLRLRANTFLEGNDRNPLILLGDFNDVPEAQTSLLLAGPPGSEIGTLGFDRPDKGDDARLFNLAPLIPADRRFSRVHRGRGELLDQIFASEELLPAGAAGKRRVPAVDSLVDFDQALPSIGDNPGERTAEIAPDHAPVTAVFAI
jgi:endonuclease/exonuclease/phosphatase family metal-dependent hydrolase